MSSNEGAKKEAKQIVEEAEQILREAKDYLMSKGIKYELDLWLTPKRYADKYGLASTNIVTNWIARGIIPPEDVQEFEDLNGLKLVRDKVYKN